MARHVFSREQMTEYFDRISMPQAHRIYDVSDLNDEAKLGFLNRLQKHQLCKVPWENIAMHYSFHRVINVRPNHLFKKIVHKPGTGGYCMEVNYLFHLILHNLGFQVYMAGARIFRAATNKFGGWTHVVNVVTIDGVRYLLDGGLGPTGPERPVPLRSGEIVPQIAPAQMCLDYENISQNLDSSQRLWVYKYRINSTAKLAPVYCFTDLEFTPEDIESMNFEPMLNPQTFFAHRVVCVRFTTDRENDDGGGPGSPDETAMEGEIDGAMSLNHDILRWRRRGEKVAEVKMESENSRLQVLSRYFGIECDEGDIDYITGSGAHLTGPLGAVPGLA